MTDAKEYIEIQGTGRIPFTQDELEQLLQLGQKGILELIQRQREVLGIVGSKPRRCLKHTIMDI